MSKFYDRPVFYGKPRSPYGQYILDAARPEMAGIINGWSMANKVLIAAQGYRAGQGNRVVDDVRGMEAILQDYGFLLALEAACYIRF